MSARRVAVGGCAPRWVPLHKRQSSREFAKSELQGYLGAELSSEAHGPRLADLQLYMLPWLLPDKGGAAERRLCVRLDSVAWEA